MKLWLRACPKCGGDLRLQPDVTMSYVECVQCGLELNPVQERLLRRHGRVPQDGSPARPAVSPAADHHRVA